MLRTINLLAFVGVLYFAGAWGMQWFRAPWSFSSLGPTLTGAWEGPMQAKLGANYRLYLDLRYRELRGRATSSNLTGTARICTRLGEVYEYTLDGEASRSGDHIDLTLTFVDPARSSLWTQFEGSWDGQTLSLRPLRNPFMSDGAFVNQRTVSPADPDDRFQPTALTKADAPSFLIACGRLTG